MTSHLSAAISDIASRWLAETTGDESHPDDGHSEFGVHIEYEDLYDTIIFFTCIYIGGHVANFAKMPSLVGEIIVGILLGPPLADYVPNPEAFVLLGEVGLVLLVIEAGIDVDVSSLKLIGTRGLLIAVIGSLLPIGIAIAIAILINGTGDIKESIAAGATFGPTSVGVALSILRNGGVINTPVGQLIISAAVIDDMIALIVLSQLESLTETITAASVLVPVVAAVLFLLVGGYIALFHVPTFVNKFIHPRVAPEHIGKAELGIMFAIVLFMMPATYFAKASYLMGSFLAGLSFCTSHDLHSEFIRQFKRVMQWLLRIFFAASIGFQVPIKDLFAGDVLWKGLVFCLALSGKLAVGFMVPNFTQSRAYTGYHLRDCLVTGFSMAAEGEFAFVIAVYSVSENLINADLYASVVLAVLLSTIIPPFLLRFTISYYNRKAAKELEDLANAEMERNHDLDVPHDEILTQSQRDDRLAGDIRNRTAVFLCIQSHSEGRWGLMHQLMAKLAKLGLEIIDHRAWHPRGIDTTLVNEIYAKDTIKRGEGNTKDILKKRIDEIKEELELTINQPETARVKVQRWFPGVVQEIVESIHEKGAEKERRQLSLEASLLKEASAELNKRQNMQLNATRQRTVQEILDGMEQAAPAKEEASGVGVVPSTTTPRPRKRRQKMRSTPVVGGDLFGETSESYKSLDFFGSKKPDRPSERPSSVKMPSRASFLPQPRGHRAEITVDNETYDVRLSSATLKNLRAACSGDLLGLEKDDDNFSIQPNTDDVTTMLRGYVRQQMPLTRITEDVDSETASEVDTHNETTSLTLRSNGLPATVPETEGAEFRHHRNASLPQL